MEDESESAERDVDKDPKGAQRRDASAHSTPPRPKHASLPSEAEASLYARIAEASLLGVIVAVVAAIPTALRASALGASLPASWAYGTALLTPLTVALVLLMRSAARGFRTLFDLPRRGQAVDSIPPKPYSPARMVALGLSLWVGWSVPALAALGAALKAVTHHRGLGGVTFGILGLLAVGAVALAARRIIRTATERVCSGSSPSTVSAVVGVLSVVPPVVVIALLFRMDDSGAPLVVAGLIDGALVVVGATLAAATALPGIMKMIRHAGIPLTLLIVVVGFRQLEQADADSRAMRSAGGIASAVLTGLFNWSDQDRDGFGAHFGGGDCDEGDPKRHPAAHDVPFDGVDQDCDGRDGEPSSAAPRTETAVYHPPVEASAASVTPAVAKSPEDATPEESADAAPDIIVISLDTVRADRTSTYGYAKETTPNLTALANQGVRFDHAFAPASDTQRALIPIVSGVRLSATARGSGKWPHIDDENLTLAERLKAVGYRTGAVSSFTWIRRDRGFDQGFDRFEEAFTEDHPERGVTGKFAVERATAILNEKTDAKAPLFLWVHLFDAHAEYQEHPEFSFGDSRNGRYIGEIAFVDQRIGDLVKAVEKTGRAERTAWVVYGTHGEGLGEHRATGHGKELYNEVTHVPLVVSMPGGKQGVVVADHAVGTIDVAPTVLAIAGAGTDGVEGTSLLSAVRGEPLERRVVYGRAPERAFVIDYPLKLIRIIREKKDRHLLFDLSADPAEEKDLSEDRPVDLARLIEILNKREREHVGG